MAEQLRFGIVGCGVIGPVHEIILSIYESARTHKEVTIS